MRGENVRYIAAVGTPGKTLIVRLRPGSDFINGILQVCRDYNIQNGYISSCIGSLHKSRYVYGIPDSSVKSGSGASAEQETGHAVEFLAGQGSICHNEQGEIQIHVHGIFCDRGFLRGGHFDQPGNIIATTMELAIQEVLGVDMTRPFDPEIDHMNTRPLLLAGLISAAMLAPMVQAQRPTPSQAELQSRKDSKLAEEWMKNADWILDYDQAKAKAVETGKPILAYFTRSYAP